MTSPPLHRASFEDLVRAAKGGNHAAIEQLLTQPGRLRNLVASIVRKADPERRQLDEAYAAANLGILQALQAFDPERGVAFTTFAFDYIRGAVLRALYPVVRRHGDDRPMPWLVEFREEGDDETGAVATEVLLLDRDSDYGREHGFRRILRRERNMRVRQFVDSLPSNQREIVHELFFEQRSQDEIAATRGVSQQAVSKALNKALSRGRVALADLDLVAA